MATKNKPSRPDPGKQITRATWGDPEVPGSAPIPADDDIIIKKPSEPGGDEPEGTPVPDADDIIIKGG